MPSIALALLPLALLTGCSDDTPAGQGESVGTGPTADVVGHWSAVLVNLEAPPVPVDTLAGCAGVDGEGPGTVEVLAADLTLGGDGTWAIRRTFRSTCWPDVEQAERRFDGSWSFEVADSTVEFVSAQPEELRIGPGRLGWQGHLELPLEELTAGRYYLLTLTR